jgi:hypothetical protein
VINKELTFHGPAQGTEMTDLSLAFNIHLLSLFYPQFRSDYELLVHRFIEPQQDGYLKLKDKVHKRFLAEYFKSINPDNKKMDWQFIEKIFRIKGLANNLSRNGNLYKSDCSPDFKKWEKIRRNYIQS